MNYLTPMSLIFCALVMLTGLQSHEERKFDFSAFTSKTAYRHSSLEKLKDGDKDLDNCSLAHVSVLWRHGTRNPSAKNMKEILATHAKIIKSHSNSKLPTPFLNWKMPFSPLKEKILAAVGYEEMKGFGERFRKQVKSIDGYNDFLSQVKVISSSIPRSKNSAITFVKSFLEDSFSEEKIKAMVAVNNYQLRFFDNCPHYTWTVLKTRWSKEEFKKFMKGDEIKSVIKDIKRKWNLDDVDLHPEDVRNLYIMCAFEIATNSSTSTDPNCSQNPTCGQNKPTAMSPLCSLLEPEHLPIFEYLDDLKHYWTKAYTTEINWLQSCDLMSPMLQNILNAVRSHQNAVKAAKTSSRPLKYYLEKEEYLRAAFWFGHAETLLPVITLLGMFNQSSPMSASSYQKRFKDINDPKQRFNTFRVSNISPFAGNVALEIYHCPHLTQGDVSGYRVKVMSNEKPIRWSLSKNGLSHIALETFSHHLGICLPERYDHEAICFKGLSSKEYQMLNRQQNKRKK